MAWRPTEASRTQGHNKKQVEAATLGMIAMFCRVRAACFQAGRVGGGIRRNTS